MSEETAHVVVPAATRDPDLGEVVAAITAAWDAAMTPPELRAAILEFVTGERTGRHVDHLRASLLIVLGGWIIEGARAGQDRHMLEQIAAAETQRAVAMLMRAAKERRGETYVAARQAIVAYFMADNVARAEPFKCDIDGAVAAFDADESTTHETEAAT